MSFDYTTSSFLALLVIKLYKKQRTKLKRKVSTFRSTKNVQIPFFVPLFLTLFNPSARLEKLRWPVMIVKLRKEKKIFRKFENNSKF